MTRRFRVDVPTTAGSVTFVAWGPDAAAVRASLDAFLVAMATGPILVSGANDLAPMATVATALKVSGANDSPNGASHA